MPHLSHALAGARAALAVLALGVSATAAGAQAASTGAAHLAPGYMDIGPTIGVGGIGSAGIALGGRFERALRRVPGLGNGTIGIQASFDMWSYDDRFVGVDYDFRYINVGVTANYHFALESHPRIDPFLGLGLGNSTVSTDWTGSHSSGIYFIGRAGVRYFLQPRLALYADAGAGASALNLGATFGLGGGGR